MSITERSQDPGPIFVCIVREINVVVLGMKLVKLIVLVGIY